MGRAKGSHVSAAAGRRAGPDGFAAVFGHGRSGAGLPPLRAATDPELLAAAMTLPADGPQRFAGVLGRFSGAAFAMDPGQMRVLHAQTGPGGHEDGGTTYLVAGRADGHGPRAGHDAFIVFNVSGDDIGQDDVWMDGGDFADLPAAVDAFNASCQQRGIGPEDDGELTAERVRALLRANLGDPGALPAPAPAPTDPPQLAALIERLAPTPVHFTGLRAAGPAFNYDPSTFRTLAHIDLPGYDDGLGADDPTTAFIVAGRADALGPRAGAHAYVAFYVQEDEDGELDLHLMAETLDIDEAVDALKQAAADLSDAALDEDAVRYQLADALRRGGR